MHWTVRTAGKRIVDSQCARAVFRCLRTLATLDHLREGSVGGVGKWDVPETAHLPHCHSKPPSVYTHNNMPCNRIYIRISRQGIWQVGASLWGTGGHKAPLDTCVMLEENQLYITSARPGIEK